MSAGRPHRWRRAVINLAVVIGLLVAVSFLPPDTSLADRQASGVLKLCVPEQYPPLVTGDPAKPGFDVALAGQIAEQLGLRLLVNVLPSMGRDFNPRNWFLTRAQCDVIGGGVADTRQTRSFLQTLPTGVATGWVGLSPDGTMPGQGGAVAVLPGTSGLDRLALSSWLRAQGLRGRLASSPAELETMIASGDVGAAVTERFVASAMTIDPDRYQIFWLDLQSLPAFPMALGLWKGDQTLMRAVRGAVSAMRRDGSLEALRSDYGIDGDALD